MRSYPFFFFAILILVLAFIDKGQISGDGAVRWKALVQLMEHRQLNSDKFSIIQPILAAPLYWTADLWVKSQNENIDDSRRIRLIKKVVQRFNKFVVLIIAIFFYWILRNFFQLDQMKAFLGTLFLFFGSILIPNAADFYSECLGCLLLLFTLILLIQLCVLHTEKLERFWNAALLIVCMPLLIALNPITCIPLGFVLAFLFFLRFKKGSALTSRVDFAVLLGVIAWIIGISLVFGENFLRRGDILNFGYADEFRGSFVNGFVGLLVSPTRGILFFIPTIFLGIPVLWKMKHVAFRSRGLLFVALTLIYSISLVLAYSKYYYWHGGWYWGPRYMLALSVFGTLYLTTCRFQLWSNLNRGQRAIWVAVAIFSISVYKTGVTINQRHLLKCMQTYPLDERCYWDFDYLPYISFFSATDLQTMIFHRSTLVEIASAALFALLFFHTKRKTME